MATKLKILATLLLLSLTAFSQTDTSKKDTCTITLSCIVANKVATDLVKGDSAIAELQLTQELLALTQEKCAKQGIIIDTYEKKDSTYKLIIADYQNKESIYKSTVVHLEKDKKRLKLGLRVLGFAVGVTSLTALIGFLGH